MRASTVNAVAGALIGLFGTALLLGGVTALSNGEPPLLCIVGVVLGVILINDGSKCLNQYYPRERFRERVARLGNPTGKSLMHIRNALGREHDFEKTANGANLTWRVGAVSLTLGFDAGKVCTGVVASKGAIARVS